METYTYEVRNTPRRLERAAQRAIHYSRSCVRDDHFTGSINDSSSGQGGTTTHQFERGTPFDGIFGSAGASSGAVSEVNFPKIGEGSSWYCLHCPLSIDTLRVRVLVRSEERGRGIFRKSLFVDEAGVRGSTSPGDSEDNGHLYVVSSATSRNCRPVA